jgi:hypothetical protein
VLSATGLAVAVAVALALVAIALAVLALRRPAEGRQGLTMRLSLTLLRYDEGLALLAAHAARGDAWWEDAPAEDRQRIELALSMWDLAAWYVETKRVDRRAVLDVFQWQIVDIWERAYPYIQYRRTQQLTLWASLTDLYLDAYDATPLEARVGGLSPWLEEPLPTVPAPRAVVPDAVAESVVPVELEPVPATEPERVAAAVQEPAVQEEPAAPEPVAAEPIATEPVVVAAEPTVAPADEPEPEVIVETTPAEPRPEVRDPWVARLREAGPVVSPMAPVPVGADLLRLRQALVHLDNPAPPPVAEPARRPVAAVNTRPVMQLDLAVDQVVDVTESSSVVRRNVSG